MISFCVAGEGELVLGPALESNCNGLIRAKHRTMWGAHTVAMLLESVSVLEGICIGIAGGALSLVNLWRRGERLSPIDLIDRMWRCPGNIIGMVSQRLAQQCQTAGTET